MFYCLSVHSTGPEFCKREKRHGAKTCCCQEKGSNKQTIVFVHIGTVHNIHKDTS